MGFKTKLTNILLASVRAASAGITDDPGVIVSGRARANYGKEVLWKMLPQGGQATLIKEAMEWRRARMPVEGSTSEKVVPLDKVEDHLRRGWSFVARLDDRRYMMRRRKRERTTQAGYMSILREDPSWPLEQADTTTMR